MQQDEKNQLNKLVRDVEDLTRSLELYIRQTEKEDVGISKDVKNIEKDIAEIKVLIVNNYVRREEFNPVQKIVYGLVSIILMSVVGAMIALIIKV